jgi:hydroxymethylpyrimidine pyrophosphatase-like HAD family hydrolase
MMGNAAPGLRALGFEETASNDENGLALAIERYVLR